MFNYFDEEATPVKNKELKPAANPSSTEKYVDKSHARGEENKGERLREAKIPVVETPVVNTQKEEKRDIDSRPEKEGDSGRLIDFISVTCSFVTAASFIFGATFVHPFGGTWLDDPFMFWLIGALFYTVTRAIDVSKRTHEDILEKALSCVGLFGSILWCVGSIFLLNSAANMTAWAALWISGSLLNLFIVTHDIVLLFRSPVTHVYEALALAMAWLANILFLSGAAHLIVLSKRGAFTCDIINAAGVLISGGIMFFIHSTFRALPLLVENIVISIQIYRVGEETSS
jgi:hypothetical protein